MSYLNWLNDDIFSIIFNYLDTYEIVNLCISHKICNISAFHKIKIYLENNGLQQCDNCGRKCVDIKTCVMNKAHKLCDTCTSICHVCNNYILLNNNKWDPHEYSNRDNDSCRWCDFDRAVDFYSDHYILPNVYYQGKDCDCCKKPMCHRCASWFAIGEYHDKSQYKKINNFSRSAYVCGLCIKSGRDYIKKCDCGNKIKEEYRYTCDTCKKPICLVCDSDECKCSICIKCIPLECYDKDKICNKCM
jgi:hypothetical protein